jgi:hypothetical protein
VGVYLNRLKYIVGISLMELLSRILLGMPIIGNKIKSSDGYLLGQSQYLFATEDYQACFKLALQGLRKEKKNSKKMSRYIFFEFVRFAVLSAAKLKDRSSYDEIKQVVLNEEWHGQGRDVAESIVKLSLLGHFFQDKDGMKELANLAGKIDGSWGEPNFLLGWYGLPDKGSVSHFNDAISKDPLYRERILSDSLCNKYPEIIAEITRKAE